MKTGCIRSFFICVAMVIGLTVQAEEIRDYYEEPGLNPFKETVDQSFNESIDPFGGTLQLKYTDLFLPGNGGLDISVVRAYTNLQDRLDPQDITGIGWTMHFGRLVVPNDHADKICTQQLWSVTTADNPSFEHPDGARELLVLRQDDTGGLISRSNWKLDCIGDIKVVTAPNGTVYRMDVQETTSDNQRWLPSEITDVHNNKLTFSYGTFPSGIKYTQQIDASDGRVVNFEYVNEHLSVVRANDQRIEYFYQPITDIAGNRQHLTEVLRSDGLSWKYEYNPMFGDGVTAGSYSLNHVTYPYGATIAYGYQYVTFDNDPGGVKTVAIATKQVGGRDITQGSWVYTFKPGGYLLSQTGRYLDETIIDTPAGQELYRHYGNSYVSGTINALWLMGLLYERSIYDNGQLLESTMDGWGKREISIENYWHGRSAIDEFTYSPILLERWVWQDGGAVATYYSEHDEFGNPARVEQTSNVQGYPNKVTTLTYYNNTNRWIIGLTKDETILGAGTVARAYNELGLLDSENRYGVETTYTYTGEGDLATMTDALLRTVTYSNYHRGIAQQEIHPENVLIDRIVNNTGTVASETNGRRFTKQFSYDGLNRLTGITYPKGNPVAVSYSSTGKQLTRGNYRETTTFDGFGNTLALSREDVASGEQVILNYAYDSLGRKVFQSYLNSAVGDTYAYDALGRVKSLVHADSSSITYNYLWLGHYEVVDENNHANSYLSLHYGDTQSHGLIQVLSDSDNILTNIDRNLLGQVTEVFQGEFNGTNYSGQTKTYSYNQHYYLEGISMPEIDDTIFGRDILGNMLSKRIGLQPETQYVYDDLDRQVQAIYPAETPSVSTSYDENGNVIYVTNGIASMLYQYDENDNAVREEISIGALDYIIGYTVDGNDFVSTVTYPSGRVVQLNPDALGRPTQTAPYVSQIGYHPSGQVSTMSFANGQTTSITLDPRMRIDRIHAVGISNAVDITYGYDYASNILGITNALYPNQDLSLGYDAINRLQTAGGVWGSMSFEYDAIGNIRKKTVNGGASQYDYSGNLLRNVTQSENARQYNYDAYGNVEYSSLFNTSLMQVLDENYYSYNHAAQLVSAQRLEFGETKANKTFGYDGNNQRVTALSGDQVTHYVYSRSGILLGEYAGSLTHGKEHIYVGAQLVATVKDNEPPIANAGPDRQVPSGSQATLDGGASLDNDGTIVSWLWEQISGPAGSLLDATSPIATYLVPTGVEGQTASFRLTVTDDSGESSADTTTLSIIPSSPPVANAGPDQTVLAESLVTLDGSASTSSANPLVYEWTQISGSGISLSNADSATPTFLAPSSLIHRSYGFQLRITDQSGQTATDTVTVMVVSLTHDSDGDGLPDAWEFIHFGDWSLYDGESDPDGDGILNRQEYAEETDPATPEQSPAAIQTIYGTPGENINVLTWEPVKSASGYQVYWGLSPNFDLASANLIDNAMQPVLHQNLTNGVPYYYAVTAYNNTGISDKSDELMVMPGNSQWHDRVSQAAGDDVASNVRGDKVIIWSVFNNGQYELYLKQFDHEFGWKDVVTISADDVRFESISARIDENRNIVVGWLQVDQSTGYKKLRVKHYSKNQDLWSSIINVGPRVVLAGEITANVVDFVDLHLLNGRIVVAWTQETAFGDGEYFVQPRAAHRSIENRPINSNYDAVRIDAQTQTTSNCSYGPSGGPYYYDYADSKDVRVGVITSGSDEYLATIWTRDEMDGQTYNYARFTRLYTHTSANHYFDNNFNTSNCPIRLNNGTGSSVSSVGVDSNKYAWILTNEILNGKNVLYQREIDIINLQRRSQSVIRELKKNSGISSAFINVSEAGDKYYAWLESGSLYSANSNNLSSVTNLANSSRNSSVHNVQSLLGKDEGYVVSWLLSGNATVARYDKNSVNWSFHNVNEQPSSSLAATWQFTAINGIGHIDTLWRDSINQVYLSSFKPTGASLGDPNQLPAANAGPNQSVVTGTQVVLDGSASADPDGVITAYYWQQIIGPIVTLDDNTIVSPRFTAPYVTEETPLEFELTVTDDLGATASDRVVVTVQPEDTGPTPIETTLSSNRSSQKGIIHYQITLSANQPATTYFRATGQGTITGGGDNIPDWQAYSSPVEIVLDKKGSMTFEYYSVDLNGNEEAVRQEILQ